MRLAQSFAAACAAALIVTGGAHAAAPSPAVTAALADASRPAADKARDAERRSAEVAAFSGVKAGDKVADIWPGGGYYTRIFAALAGPGGHVYMFIPTEAANRRPQTVDNAKALAGGYRNVSVTVQKTAEFAPPEKLDVVFNFQFYHDMYIPDYGGPDIARINKAVFDSLKPGGLYIVIDHAAPNGSGVRDVNTAHRIDEAAARQALQAAGFQLVEESQMLRNPADRRDLNVFNPEIRGKTDQFVLKFRKPG
jgi:predicted methyltransferase